MEKDSAEDERERLVSLKGLSFGDGSRRRGNVLEKAMTFGRSKNFAIESNGYVVVRRLGLSMVFLCFPAASKPKGNVG